MGAAGKKNKSQKDKSMSNETRIMGSFECICASPLRGKFFLARLKEAVSYDSLSLEGRGEGEGELNLCQKG